MRNAGYLMSNYVEDLNRGDNYIKMHKHIQINFTKGLPQDRGIEEIYTLTNVKSGHNYIENFTIIEYNILNLTVLRNKKLLKAYFIRLFGVLM